VSTELPEGGPWQWSLVDAAAAIRERRITACELLDSILGRIEAVEPDIHAFSLVDPTFARRQADQLDRELSDGAPRGPLHGIPLGVKDIFDVEGLPTKCGSALYVDAAPATADADVVGRLRAAGGLLVGKTTTHELACGVYTPPTRNPWDLSRCCGGSSGGSGAAVAAGAVMGGTGSDTGGSIRIPAALCGVVGIKPSYGVLSRSGVAALSWSLDHVGPLARSVDDAALLLQTMLDPADGHPAVFPVVPANLDGAVLGISTDPVFTRVEPAVRAAFDTACTLLEEAGARLVDVAIPGLEDTLTIEFAIVMAEAAAYHSAAIRERPGSIDEGIRRLFQAGALLPAEDYLVAQRLRAELCRDVARVYAEQGLHAIVAPSIPVTPYRPDELEREIDGLMESITDANVRTTAPFNLTGLPAVALPMGLTEDDLPVGIQFVGRPFGEAEVVGLARSYEQRRDSRRLDEVHPLRRPHLA